MREEKCLPIKQLNGQLCYNLYKESIETNGLIHSQITPKELQTGLWKISKIGNIFRFLQSREDQTKTLTIAKKIHLYNLAKKD